MVLREQHRIAWKSFVYEEFSTMPHSATNRHRRLVALLLAFAESKVAVKHLPKLNVELASGYGGEERKVYRDVAFLQELGLVIEDGQFIAANTARIEAFKPFSRRV